jgi:HSP20 family protein
MTRRRPLSDIEELLNRLTEELDEGLRSDLTLHDVTVDVVDRGDAFLVTADLPGFERDDLAVELVDDRLRIQGERTGERDEEDLTGRYIRRERTREDVSRSVTLPEKVDSSAVSATFSRGVLEVTLPKAADIDEGQEIEIE